jgi:hypothetical protein
VDLILVLQLDSALDHRLYETLSTEGKSYCRNLSLVADTLSKPIVATTSTECILSATRSIDELPHGV